MLVAATIATKPGSDANNIALRTAFNPNGLVYETPKADKELPEKLTFYKGSP